MINTIIVGFLIIIAIAIFVGLAVSVIAAGMLSSKISEKERDK